MRDFTWLDVGHLVNATRWTLILTAIAFFGGGLIGAIVTLARISRGRSLREAARLYIVFLQGTPLLMQIFLVYFGLLTLGFKIAPIVAAAAALTAYASAFFAEIWRGAIESIPRQQWEASASLALNRREQLIHVIIPQGLRIALPTTVGFAVQVVKNTSLVSILGFLDLTRVGQLISNATLQPFSVYSTVAAIYFLLCFPLSVLSRYLERKLHVGR
jgi:polar amino acid transport system permease protein